MRNQPEWSELTSIEDAKEFANKVNYPVPIRPCYVLSGAAMSIVLVEDEVEMYLNKAAYMNIPLITNIQFAQRFIRALEKYNFDEISFKSWDEYE